MDMSEKGLLLVLTGNGKGKTTSALGQALRAAGNGMHVCFIQFIKGGWRCGEVEAIKRFADIIDFRVMGRGFTWKSDDIEKDRALAVNAWNDAREAMMSGDYRLVVLDEFTYVLNYGMVDTAVAVSGIASRPAGVHVVVTGRDAPSRLVAEADLVTEMRDIRHPYRKGVKARRGIEF